MARIVTINDLNQQRHQQVIIQPYPVAVTYDSSPIIPIRNKLVKEVAIAALKELAVSLLLATATVFFVASGASIAALFSSAIITVIFNAVVRSIPRYYQYQSALIERELRSRSLSQSQRTGLEQLRDAYIEKAEHMGKMANFICPSAFVGVNYMAGAGTLIHESGHALAATMVYQNPQPVMEVVPFKGGNTKYFTGTLSSFGKVLGQEGSSLFVAGAGAGIWVILSTLAVIIAHRREKKNPRLCAYLVVLAIVAVAHHAFYAISALYTSMKERSHDFVRLWLGGIHPIVSAIVIIAIPLIAKAAMVLYEHCRSKPAQPLLG